MVQITGCLIVLLIGLTSWAQSGQVIDDVIGGPVGAPGNPLQGQGYLKRDNKYGLNPGPIGGTVVQRDSSEEKPVEPFRPSHPEPTDRPTPVIDADTSIDPGPTREHDAWADTQGVKDSDLLHFDDTTGEYTGGGRGERQPVTGGGARAWPIVPGGPEISVPPETRRESLGEGPGYQIALDPAMWLETRYLWQALSMDQQKQALVATLTALTAGTAYMVLGSRTMRLAARRALAILGPVGIMIGIHESALAAEELSEVDLRVEEISEFFNDYDHAEAMLQIQGPDMLNFYRELNGQLRR